MTFLFMTFFYLELLIIFARCRFFQDQKYSKTRFEGIFSTVVLAFAGYVLLVQLR